mmetsp:Transcript_2321/g.5546  ORF Transcript_2321/g.5546 Transcript_2321/m.5546 type:complete len:142 (+) Transcript_2321:60-485(+)
MRGVAGMLIALTQAGVPDRDNTCHWQCGDGTHCVYINAMPNDFCTRSGYPNSMGATNDDPAHPDKGTWCASHSGQPWCICKWAYAGVVHRDGCDYLDIDCSKSGMDGIGNGVCNDYNEGTGEQVQQAKECIRKKCGKRVGC